MSFNPAQLASYPEARALRAYLNATPQFSASNIQILPGDDEVVSPPTPDPNFPWLVPLPPTYGIYIPVWSNVPGAGPAPNDGDKLWLHYAIDNGKKGFNVGLAIDKFKRYPASPDYVVSELAKEYSA